VEDWRGHLLNGDRLFIYKVQKVDAPMLRCAICIGHTWPSPCRITGRSERSTPVVDSHDLIWIGNQSNHLTNYDWLFKGASDCGSSAADHRVQRAGDVVKSWNVSAGPGACQGYRCLDGVHTVYVDYQGQRVGSRPTATATARCSSSTITAILLQIGGSMKKAAAAIRTPKCWRRHGRCGMAGDQRGLCHGRLCQSPHRCV